MGGSLVLCPWTEVGPVLRRLLRGELGLPAGHGPGSACLFSASFLLSSISSAPFPPASDAVSGPSIELAGGLESVESGSGHLGSYLPLR